MIPMYSAGSKEKFLTSLNEVKLWITKVIYKKKIGSLSKKYPQYFEVKDNGPQKHVHYWESRGFKNVDRRWYLWYRGCSGIDDEKYVPEDIYYTRIEPNLNNQYLSLAYADKNLYEQRYDPDLFPPTVLRCINGIFYDRYYNVLNEKNVSNLFKGLEEGVYILKPSIDSGGGKNVQFITIVDGEPLDARGKRLLLGEIKKWYRGNFLIQRKIEQNDFFTQFHNSSTNTVRLMTYYSEYSDEVYPLKATMRMGVNNSTLDNETTGGISCGIYNNGHLNSYAVDKYGSKHFEHPSSGVAFEGKSVPKYEAMIDIAKQLHRGNSHHRLLSFDLTMDMEGNVIVIEINNKNMGINFLQLFGGPLFGGLTEEVIEISKKQENGSRILWY
jgi:hypothetical protein